MISNTYPGPENYLQFASQFYVGASSFHESYFVSELPQGHYRKHHHFHRPWGDYFARFSRYTTFWAHYENNVYREVHIWADLLKDSYGLYNYTRSIFSPAYRLVEFWATHILGGALDPLAGDGIGTPSAIPIVTGNEAIRPLISQIWRDSNWQAKKEIFTRFGAAMGDAALMVVDDPVAEKVQLRVVDPRTLRDVVRDSFGNVKAYIIEEQRPDPESPVKVGMPVYATYTEACEKVNDSIRYATFRNGLPYDWRLYPDGTPDNQRVGPEWTEDYDFVPMVFVQNRDVGLGWGWSELQPSLSKLHELDDLASKLSDWIRVTVDCPWLFTGVLPPGVPGSEATPTPGVCTTALVVAGGDDDDGDRGGGSGRNRIPMLYSTDKDTKAHPLIANMPVDAVSAHIRTIVESLQEDHPELLADNVGLAASGEARKVAREKIEAQVVQRRSGYDDALVRAHQMSISIGAIKGYPGFGGFTADSFVRGELDHSIGPRPVFAVDQSSDLADLQIRATILKTMTDAGIPVEEAMEAAGYPPEQVAAVRKKLADAEAKAERAAGAHAAMFGDLGGATGVNARLGEGPQPDGNGNGSVALVNGMSQ